VRSVEEDARAVRFAGGNERGYLEDFAGLQDLGAGGSEEVFLREAYQTFGWMEIKESGKVLGQQIAGDEPAIHGAVLAIAYGALKALKCSH
jgi:hypothetical protein